MEYSTEEARGVLEHRLLRPLSSELRSEVTSEVAGSLGGHFSNSSGINSQLGIASSFLLHSLVVKVSDFGARGPGFKSYLRQSKKATRYFQCNTSAYFIGPIKTSTV